MKTICLLLAGLFALALTAGETLLISYGPTNQVLAYSTNGTSLGVFAGTGLSNPMGIAVDVYGQVIVANYDNNTLSRYSPTGEYLGVLTSAGLTNPAALAYDSAGELFVANLRGNNIMRYSASGSYLGEFTSSGIVGPGALALDGIGNVFVANNIGNTITKYDSSGALLKTIASSASGLNAPLGLAWDGRTNLYVANEFGLTVQRYAASGASMTFHGFEQPMDVKIDAAGNIWVLDAGGVNGARMFHYSPAWELLNSFSVNGGLGARAFVIYSSKGPALRVSRLDQQVVLGWPTNAGSFVVQQNSNLASTNWTTLSTTNLDGTYIVRPTDAQNFFRLKER